MQCCACAQVVASGDVGGVIKIWNVLDGVCTRTFGALSSHRPPIADLQWHPEQPELIAVMCARAAWLSQLKLAARVSRCGSVPPCTCDAGRIGRYTPNVLAVWNVVSGVRQWLYDSKARARRAKPSASRARRTRHAPRPSRTEARTPTRCVSVCERARGLRVRLWVFVSVCMVQQVCTHAHACGLVRVCRTWHSWPCHCTRLRRRSSARSAADRSSSLRRAPAEPCATLR